jgi:hypothetical protein
LQLHLQYSVDLLLTFSDNKDRKRRQIDLFGEHSSSGAALQQTAIPNGSAPKGLPAGTFRSTKRPERENEKADAKPHLLF